MIERTAIGSYSGMLYLRYLFAKVNNVWGASLNFGLVDL